MNCTGTCKIYSEDELEVWLMDAATSAWQEFVRSKLGAAEFGKTAGGKPFAVGSEWQFNISHSGEYLVVALARGREVGVDIERVKPVVHLERLVDRYFSGEPIADETSFCVAWVRREALLKASGVGLAGLTSFRELPAGWRLVDLSVPEGYRGALVICQAR